MVSHVFGQIGLVELWKTNEQGVLIAVSAYESHEVWERASIKSFLKAFLLQDMLRNLNLILEMRLSLPLYLDGVNRVLQRKPNHHTTNTQERAL